MAELENSITSYFGVIAPDDLKTIVSFSDLRHSKKVTIFLKERRAVTS